MNDSKMSVSVAVGTIVFTTLCLVSKYEAVKSDADIKMDDSIESVLCQRQFAGAVKCTDQGVLLRFGYCATYEEGEGIFVTRCPYFELKGHNVTEAGYLQLPDNISELNNYVCGPMNRKGFLCKDCIDGFGPSVTSLRYKCSNCTDVWYRIPLYLAVELVPLTLFYLIILVFKVNLTSAPMTLFILYCHLIMYEMLFGRSKPLVTLLLLEGNRPFLLGLLMVLGIWNLDFVRYVAPPFCVSTRLLPIHISLLDYSTNFYPLLLIIFTCICIELHDRNCKPLVWFWRPLCKYFTRFHRKWDTQNDIIDVFASFFLLFYVKNMYLGSSVLMCYSLKGVKRCINLDGDISLPNYAYLILPLIFLFNILPVLLLVLYPLKWFRRCLSRCKLDRLFLTTFVEKFHGCYRDGLDGGRDMRSFSGMYFLLIILSILGHRHFLREWKISHWLYQAFIFLIFALVVALIQPYKKKYINVLDTLLFAHLTIAYLLLSRNYFTGYEVQIFVVLLLPTTVFVLLLIFKLITKFRIRLLRQYKLCKHLFKRDETVAFKNQSSRELINPTSTFVDIRRYGTLSENLSQ